MIKKDQPKDRRYEFDLVKSILPNASKSPLVLINPKPIGSGDRFEELGGKEDKLAKMSNSYVLGTVRIYEIDSTFLRSYFYIFWKFQIILTVIFAEMMDDGQLVEASVNVHPSNHQYRPYIFALGNRGLN